MDFNHLEPWPGKQDVTRSRRHRRRRDKQNNWTRKNGFRRIPGNRRRRRARPFVKDVHVCVSVCGGLEMSAATLQTAAALWLALHGSPGSTRLLIAQSWWFRRKRRVYETSVGKWPRCKPFTGFVVRLLNVVIGLSFVFNLLMSLDD